MASGAPTTLGPSILAASSPNINLSTNMASEAISKHLTLKKNLGGACPQTPLACACLRTHHRRCIDNTAVLYYLWSVPPNLKYLPPPLDKLGPFSKFAKDVHRVLHTTRDMGTGVPISRLHRGPASRTGSYAYAPDCKMTTDLYSILVYKNDTRATEQRLQWPSVYSVTYQTGI